MTKKSIQTKNQHFVPRCYLKNFLDENGKIAVLDKQNLKIYKTNINNVANQNYFYDLPKNEHLDIQFFEKMFNTYEAEYGNKIKILFESLKSIKENSFNDTLEEFKNFFALYFCLQWVRTLQTRKLASNILKLVLEQIKKNLGGESTEIIIHEDKLMPLQARFIMRLLTGNIPKYLSNQYFFVLINDTNIPFYCSDNPAIMDSYFGKKNSRGSGFCSYGMNFYLPLSSKYCLLIADIRLFKEPPKCNILIIEEVDSIIYANDLQIQKATNQIYCNNLKFLENEQEYLKNINLL